MRNQDIANMILGLGVVILVIFILGGVVLRYGYLRLKASAQGETRNYYNCTIKIDKTND